MIKFLLNILLFLALFSCMFLIMKFLTPKFYDFKACQWLYEHNNLLDFSICFLTLSDKELETITGR